MIETLVHLLIVLLVLGIIYWAVSMTIDLLPAAEPFKQAARIILLLILLLIVLMQVLPLAGVHL